jgi:hypothetical protein
MKVSKKIVRMGIDLGNKTISLFGVDESGSGVLKKKRRRKPWLEYFANRPLVSLIWRSAVGVSTGLASSSSSGMMSS